MIPFTSKHDQRALEVMETTARLKHGHYEIALPWRNDPPRSRNNKPQAEKRLRLLKRSLQGDTALLEKYKAFMQALLDNDHARKLTKSEVAPFTDERWYLPHHPVFHPQKPGKVRVVFDCSANYANSSLNDQLLQGPDLTNTLIGVPIRFREEPIAFMPDIEAMFYQVRVSSKDRDYLRFLWWPDCDLSQPAEEYQMLVHLFGGASSPSCANYALKKTAEDNKQAFDQETVKTVKENFYVDDCLKSVASTHNAVRLANQLRALLA